MAKATKYIHEFIILLFLSVILGLTFLTNHTEQNTTKPEKEESEYVISNYYQHEQNANCENYNYYNHYTRPNLTNTTRSQGRNSSFNITCNYFASKLLLLFSYRKKSLSIISLKYFSDDILSYSPSPCQYHVFALRKIII